jgi:hypothetical protein
VIGTATSAAATSAAVDRHCRVIDVAVTSAGVGAAQEQRKRDRRSAAVVCLIMLAIASMIRQTEI